MTDSIQSLDSPRLNRLHGTSGGRLHRGHNAIAYSATIPSKYQTVVIDNADKKGFGAKSRRFQYEMNEATNPSCSSYDITHGFTNNSPSVSKKGTGGFASRQKRSWKLESGCGAEPNLYTLPSTLQSKKDFNMCTATSSFHPDIAIRKPQESRTPAANKYNVSNVSHSRFKENHVAAAGAFKSNTKREFLDTKETLQKPGPGNYDITRADGILRVGERVPFSSFKSTTMRRMCLDPPKFPGPGTYKPHEPVDDDLKKIVFPKKHYLCLSAPALPLPPTPASPGPGQYELVTYERPRHFMAGSVFLSNSSRWGNLPGQENIHSRADLPGPSHYHPSKPLQQSFLYNATGKWVC